LEEAMVEIAHVTNNTDSRIGQPLATVSPAHSGQSGLVRLDDWVLTERIHRGTRTDIFRARPANSNHNSPGLYAIKVARQETDQTLVETTARLLAREAQVGQSVNHPHLVPVLAAELSTAPNYTVMPWLEGKTVQQWLDASSCFSLSTSLWIIRQTAEAIDELSAALWRHGDIKPSNLIVSTGGHLTLIDLEFATPIDTAPPETISGSIDYLAPELITGKANPSEQTVDSQSDIYSLGILAFQLIGGQLPYRQENGGPKNGPTVIDQHQSAPVPELIDLNNQIPTELSNLIRRMMAKSPHDRPSSTTTLVDTLLDLEINLFSCV
jgi:eukaryotic-like serine/threonine-protein kinase